VAPFPDLAEGARGTLTSVLTSYVPESRTRGLALAGLLLATVLGAASVLLGLVPWVVEPGGSPDPVECGSTWFRGAGLPAECYTELDVWAVAAKVGLAVAAALLVVSGTVLGWARRKQSEGPGSAGFDELAIRGGH
jgi:hypothetical protein